MEQRAFVGLRNCLNYCILIFFKEYVSVIFISVMCKLAGEES
jgi:hypothetical protein